MQGRRLSLTINAAALHEDDKQAGKKEKKTRRSAALERWLAETITDEPFHLVGQNWK